MQKIDRLDKQTAVKLLEVKKYCRIIKIIRTKQLLKPYDFIKEASKEIAIILRKGSTKEFSIEALTEKLILNLGVSKQRAQELKEATLQELKEAILKELLKRLNFIEALNLASIFSNLIKQIISKINHFITFDKFVDLHHIIKNKLAQNTYYKTINSRP